MRSGERANGGGSSRRRAPRPAPAASAVRTAGGPTADGPSADGDGGRLGPLAVGSGYSPWRDPTVLVLLVISLVAAALFVGGATFGPGLGGGGGDGVFPVIDILTGDDGGDGPALTLEANRTELTIGDRVAFTVTDADGTPVRNATVTVAGRSRTVDEEGRVVVVLDRSGTQVASASAAGENDTVLESDDVDLTVAPRRVDLAVQANRTSATAGEPIGLTLVRADTGTPLRGSIATAVVPEGASIASSRTWHSLERDDGASHVVVPARSGTLLVWVAREDEGGERFRPAMERIRIDRRPVALELSVDATEPTVEEPVEATVRRAGTDEPVAARLAIEGPDGGTRTVETGADGTAELSFETAGARTIEATAPSTPAIRFTPDSSTVAVQRREVPLAVDLDRPAITRGGRVGFSVTRADTGAPIEGAVEIAGERHETRSVGTMETSVDAVGEHEVLATAPDTPAETYVPATGTLTVANATIELEGIDAPDAAAPGETVRVATNATNRGPADGADTFELHVDGENVDPAVREREVVAIDAGEQRRVAFQVTLPEEPGSYGVSIRGSDGAVLATIEVEG